LIASYKFGKLKPQGLDPLFGIFKISKKGDCRNPSF